MYRRTSCLLVSAIQANDFMKHLDGQLNPRAERLLTESRSCLQSGGQISALTACMYPVSFPAGAQVLREGDAGNVLYIIESGILEVFNETVSGRRLGRERFSANWPCCTTAREQRQCVCFRKNSWKWRGSRVRKELTCGLWSERLSRRL